MATLNRLAVALAFLAAVAGCGPSSSLGIVTVASLPYEQWAATEGMQVLPSAPASAATLGPVEGTSCMNKIGDEPPTEEDALLQMKARAASLGANALTSVAYQRGGYNLSKNCWATVKGTAVALKLPAS